MKKLIYKRSNYNKALYAILFVALFINYGCRKYIEVDTPATNISSTTAFQSNTGAAQFMTGVYAQMSRSIDNGTLMSTCILPELSADNLTLFDPNGSQMYVDYYKNALEPGYLTSDMSGEATYWTQIYKLLYTINTAIEHLKANTKLSPAIGNRLLGEAYFMRAFCFFYLVNFHGEVPLVLSTSYQENANLKKASNMEVYSQIESDLSKAEQLLDNRYVNGDISGNTTYRLRPNLAAVNALQARVYLYEKKYAAAEIAATKVISNSNYSLTDPDNTFKANSPETIWALQPVDVGFNSRLAYFFLLPAGGPNTFDYPVYISESLLNSFEPGDARKEKWLGKVNVNGKDYYYPAKYKRGFIPDSKDLQEYTIVLRVSEQYLIRAEARNEQGNSSAAIDDLNKLRDRSRGLITTDVPNPLPALSAQLNQPDLKAIILNERRVELFTEWAHRWFDLRRSGNMANVMTNEEQVKGGTWSDYKQYYPIPQYDITRDHSLTQTPGYTK